MALVEILVWWAVMILLMVLAAPLTAALTPSSDSGIGYALPAAIAVLTVVALWVGHLTMGFLWLLAPIVVLVGLVGATVRFTDVHVSVGALLERGAVFTVGYLAYVALRSGAPGVRPDGEQFLDYGLLMAIRRAQSLPPEDMWFAGEAVQYYYGGHLAVAHLVDLTGVAPRYAFHLAIASALAAIVVGAYELGGSAAARAGGSRIVGAVAAAGIAGFGAHAAAVVWLASPLAPVQEVATAFALPGTVAVFPLLEALEGTMHAHVLVAPLVVLAAGLAHRIFVDGHGTPELVFVAYAIVVAAMIVTSTWAAPTAMGLLVLAGLFARPTRTGSPLAGGRPGRAWTDRVGYTAVRAAGVAGLSIVVALPFMLGSGRTYGVALLAASNRSGLLDLLEVYGGLVTLFAAFLLASRRDVDGWILLGGLVAAGLLLVIPGNLGVLALVLPLGVVAARRLVVDPDPDFITLLYVAGGGLVLVVEFVYVLTDGPGNRWNTVFKTSMHVWLLWGIGAGAAAGVVAPRLRAARSREIAAVVTVGLLIPTGAYAVAAVPDHYATSGPLTLDGTRSITERHPAEMAAITALGDAVGGQPTMVSAPGDRKYQWSASPAASLTGIPTVAGWSHEAQYRSPTAYWDRVQAVDAFYTGSPETRRAFLARYSVRYVYVGPVERERYGSMPAFETMSVMDVALTNVVVTVYRVDLEALRSSSTPRIDRTAEGSRLSAETRSPWLPSVHSARS